MPRGASDVRGPEGRHADAYLLSRPQDGETRVEARHAALRRITSHQPSHQRLRTAPVVDYLSPLLIWLDVCYAGAPSLWRDCRCFVRHDMPSATILGLASCISIHPALVRDTARITDSIKAFMSKASRLLVIVMCPARLCPPLIFPCKIALHRRRRPPCRNFEHVPPSGRAKCLPCSQAP